MTTYFKIVPYLFLLLGIFALADAIMRINEGRDPIISFAFAALAVFMFFLRRKQYRRYGNNPKQ